MTLIATPDVQVLKTRPGDVEAPLSQWLLVQRAVRRAVDAASCAGAAGILESALADVGRVADARTGPDVHLAAQQEMLTDLIRLMVPGSSPRVQAPVIAATDSVLSSIDARIGDVVCLLSISGDIDPAGPQAGMPDLLRAAKAATRFADHVLALDDDHLLVLMRNVPVPVAWRRMNGLVGLRHTTGHEASRAVHAGVALVGAAGPSAALEAARACLAELITGNAGWVGIAHSRR